MANDPFISTADLSDLLGRDVSGDAAADLAVSAACQICRDVSGQTLGTVADDAVVFDGTGTDCLVLPQIPVTNVGSVSIDGDPVTDWVLADDGRLLRVGSLVSVWPLGRQNVAVTYTHGWDPVPDSIRAVALAIATRLVVEGPASSEAVGTDSVTYAGESTAVLPTEKLILRKHAGR